MKENMRLFKESINHLQQKNQELQTTALLQSGHNQHLGMSSSDLEQMNVLFNGLKDDNTRLASEIKRLVKENTDMHRREKKYRNQIAEF
jgi:hypothetical protein